MQRNCTFPGHYAPLTYYDWLRGRPRNTLMTRNAREMCNFLRVRVRPNKYALYQYQSVSIRCLIRSKRSGLLPLFFRL